MGSQFQNVKSESTFERRFLRASGEVARVLVVDDQRANLVAFEAVLGGGDYELIQAESGIEALRLIELYEFAVILLDVQMPEMDGFETARKFRNFARLKATPVIFMTAKFPDEDDALQGYEAGAVDYILKPFNPELLRAKVAVFVDLFVKSRELRRQSEYLREIESREKSRELLEIKRNGERKYQKLVDSVRNGIVWSVDVERTRFSFVSRHAERISGFPLDQWNANGRFWESHSHPEDRDRLRGAFERALAGEPGASLEHRLMKPDGQVVWLHTEINLEDGTSSAKAEFWGLSTDITHLKRTESALLEAVRVRDAFMSVASHELRTPITPLQLQMQGFLRLLDRGVESETSPEKLREMLEVSESQVSRLTRLIGHLLDASRINSGKLFLDPETLDFSEVVGSALGLLKYEIANAECRLDLRLEPNVIGRWDRLRLEQVVINLVSNAMKFGPGKPIEVAVETDGDAVRLSVKDRGIGISKENQARIFGQFEQAVSVRHFGGLGLGLYISKQIVEFHGGKISVESAPGMGAKFVVEFPARGL